MINQYEKKNKLKFYVNTNKKSGEKTQRYHYVKKVRNEILLICDAMRRCDAVRRKKPKYF